MKAIVYDAPRKFQCRDIIGVEINGAFAEYIKLRADLVFPIEKLSIRESVVIDCFPRALDYLESGKLKVDEIVTHEIPLQDYEKALDLAFARKGIKIAIIP